MNQFSAGTQPHDDRVVSHDHSLSPPHRLWLAKHSNALALAALAVLILALFRGLLWQSTSIIGSVSADMAAQFLAWRKFGFGELARGRLPLWNPYIYGGEPFFGGMQSALLYPPNILFLILPLIPALNWSAALNMWLLGAFMFAWARLRGLGASSSFFAGALIMLGGAYSPHIFAGHLPNLCSMVWAPLIMLSIDGWIERRRLKWLLIGMAAVAIQILAGHMQYVFFIAIAAGVYSLARLVQTPKKFSAAAGLLTIYPAGALLSAVQLFTGIEAASESVRNSTMDWQFVSGFSLPIENLLTFVMPTFFGDTDFYWGQYFFWEMQLFIGITALSLAIAAVCRSNHRQTWPLLASSALMLILMLGYHTPLLWLLYKYVPGFNMFRGYSKFLFPALLFIALLAAMGLDSLRRQASPRGLFVALFLLGAILFGAARWTGGLSREEWFVAVLKSEWKEPACFVGQVTTATPEVLDRTRHTAAMSLTLAAATCAILAAILLAREKWPAARSAALCLGVAEVFAFANINTASFTIQDLGLDSLQKMIDPAACDDRILMFEPHNDAMLLGLHNVWGDDPYVLKRYSEFVLWINGKDPDKPNQYIGFQKVVADNNLLRLRYIYVRSGDSWRQRRFELEPLPHVLLAGQWRRSASRNEIFSALSEGSFSPLRGQSFVERDPGLGASPESPVNAGETRIIEQGTDSLTIEADAARPAILVISDPYAKGWRARALEGSSQSKYELMPANYWMRGVPLKPGHHKLIVEYAPRSFAIGLWVTIFSLILYACAWGGQLFRSWRSWPKPALM